MHIAIPDLFACLNHNAQNAAQSRAGYAQYTQTGGKASAVFDTVNVKKPVRSILKSVPF